MTLVDERTYRFTTAAHWAAGARSALEPRGASLAVPDQMALVPITGQGPEDADALPAVGHDGGLTWLRPVSRRLAGRPLPGTSGVVEWSVLDGPAPVRRLVRGRGLYWLLSARRLDRYAADTLQRLTPVTFDGSWRATDAADDGRDGVWLVGADAEGGWQLRHVDRWGRSCRPPIPLTGPPDGELTVAVAGSQIVVVDPAAPGTSQVADPADGEVTSLALGIEDPTYLTAGGDDRFHLLTVRADGKVAYRAVRPDGGVEDHQVLEVPERLGRPTAIAGGSAGIVVAGQAGLADLRVRSGPADDRTSTFVTPALVSPLTARSGWSRADVDVVLPDGTAMEMTWAATDEAGLIAEAARLIDGPPRADLVERLDDLLPWRVDHTIIYRGEPTAGSGRATVERLTAPLDDVPATTLWLRIRFRTPPGRTPPSLVGLRVRYPDVSYLDHLPAIYSGDPRAASELRRILGPYEVLFGGLDEELDGLPGRIDPATAGDDRTDYLLSWLGFPPLGELSTDIRQALLQQAAELLRLRGTHRGLQLVLDVVTGGRATVGDSADGSPGWFLGPGSGPSAGAGPARLGTDTIASAQRPAPARAGTLVLGRTPVGQGCPDPELVLAEHATTVTVTVEVGPDDRRLLEPVLRRLLAGFVPAHCRLRTVFTAAGSHDRSRRLDVDLRLAPGDTSEPTPDTRLHGDVHWRLGDATRLGGWSLPTPPSHAVLLDHGAPLGGRLH